MVGNAIKPVKRKNKGNLTIFIFPYLFLDKEFGSGGYKLKPSYTSIFNKESSRVKGHLTKIAKSFKLRDTLFINQYTYGWLTLHNQTEWENLRKFLDTFSSLLRYQKLSENKGANYSNFDYIVFEINKPMSGRGFDYYQGVLNGYSTFSVHYPRTKFCPNFDIKPYIVQVEEESKVFNHLFNLWQTYHSVEEKDRLIRALGWFNRSFKLDLEVDNLERFISVAIAFEALFNSPAESIQASLTANITALLGETQEMTHWVKDFYDKRSRIVHGREKPTILYKGKGTTEYHLDHLYYARKVFTRCVKAIFTAREQVYTKDLHSELISNERRIKEVLASMKTQKTNKQLFEDGTFDKIDSLSLRDGTGKRADVVEIGKKLLPRAKKLLVQQARQDLVDQIDNLLSDDGKDSVGLALKYSEFQSAFSPVYFGDKTISAQEIPDLALKGAIYSYSGYMGWKLF